MNVIAKISCYFECSVVRLVTLKLCKQYLNIVTYNTPLLTPDKILNSLIYRMLFCVNIYGSYKLSKNSPVFFGPSCSSAIRQQSHLLPILLFSYLLLLHAHFGYNFLCRLAWPV